MAHRYYRDIPERNWERARLMRREMTRAERQLWRRLRGGQLGVDFRRQHPIGPFIVDFVSLEAKLVVELDGNTHASDEAKQHDSERTSLLMSHGFRVIRLENHLIYRSMESALSVIVEALDQPPLIPPHIAGGDRSADSGTHTS